MGPIRGTEERKKTSPNTIISPGWRAQPSWGFQVQTRGRSKWVGITGLCYVSEQQGAGGGQQVGHGEQWQLQLEAGPWGSRRPWPPLPSDPCASCDWWAGQWTCGHPCGPACLHIRCFSNRHAPSTAAPIKKTVQIKKMLSQLKTSSITIKGTELKQKIPFFCWEHRSVVSANGRVWIAFSEETLTNLRGTAHIRENSACAGHIFVQGGRGTEILCGAPWLMQEIAGFWERFCYPWVTVYAN